MASYATVTFLAAFLLFLVQPLLAKAVLPWFGGASSVWATSLGFYQTLLLCGYAYAHLSRRLRFVTQAGLHVGILLVTLVSLPILPAAGWRPTGTEDPTLHLLTLLTASIGAPYLLLSSTAPLLHDWFGRSVPGRSPYMLYSVSNAGSLLALVAYPFVVEPLFDVGVQASVWAIGYGVFVAGMAWIAWTASRRAGHGAAAGPHPNRERTNRDPELENPKGSPKRGRYIIWFLLAACGSGLLLATTNQMTLDLASVPFLWVMPLAIYLLTFILAFAGLYSRLILGFSLVVALVAHAVIANQALPIVTQVAGAAAVLFVACMVCHGELARSAPKPKHLTAFYLTMSAGGAAGGASVSLAAPLIFPDFWELPAFLVLAWLLLGVVTWSDSDSPLARGNRPWAWIGLVAVGGLAALGFTRQLVSREAGTLINVRNFYGVLSVLEGESPVAGRIRGLRHGRVLHGSQLQDPERMSAPTTYYAEGSGVHVAIARHPRRQSGRPLRVAAVGLGVGAVAAWGEAGDTIRFFEINPDVDRLARDFFTYLQDSRAVVEVVLGDGRLSLERDLAPGGGARRYDVIVLDAFSGDAIPTHFLTREAADLYWRALEPDGVLAMHVTNSHLDLDPVVRAMAAHTGHRLLRVHRNSDPEWDIGFSRWLLMLSDPRPFAVRGAALESLEPALIWTDRFSNLLQVLR
jgi:hypothetical protein